MSKERAFLDRNQYTVLLVIFSIIIGLGYIMNIQWIHQRSLFDEVNNGLNSVVLVKENKSSNAIQEDTNCSSKYVMKQPKLNGGNTSCNILVVKGGTKLSGFATLFYVFGINYILHANAHGKEIWFNYSKSYNDFHYESKYGENYWNYYFEPIIPQHCDIQSSKLEIFPQKKALKLHKLYDTSIFVWYYHNTTWNMKIYYEDWFRKQRQRGYDITQQYIHVKKEVKCQVNQFWYNNIITTNQKYDINIKDISVLGIQMRGSDKVRSWSIRRNVKFNEYQPYIKNWIQYELIKLNKPIVNIFVATDDTRMLMKFNEYIDTFKNDSKYTNKYINIATQNVVRSSNFTAVFELKGKSKSELGVQILIDIQLLSKCDWFLHGSSAVAEAVFYNNINLHNNSIHLEFIKNRQHPFWMNE